MKKQHSTPHNSGISKNTFRLLMLACLFYIVSQRDLSFNMGGLIDKKNDSAYSYGFEDVEMQGKKKPRTKEVAMAAAYNVTVKAEHKNTNKNVAFHNAAFLVDNDASEKYDVAPEQVRFKKKLCIDYVAKYKAIAKMEQEKFGIPASITLAQALLESNAGESDFSKIATNHFGIKCFSHQCKKGHCKNFASDSHKDFYVVYQNAWQSFRAHSEFLKQNRFAKLFNFQKNDYKNWAKGLKDMGYANDKNYDQKLIKIIENLGLQKLD